MRPADIQGVSVAISPLATSTNQRPDHMDGSTKLSHVTLGESLRATCYAVADAWTSSGDLSVIQVDEDIPDHVFMLAIYARWIPEPIAPIGDAVELGLYLVEKSYRDDFIALIEGALDALREVADDGTEPLPTLMPVWAEAHKSALVRDTSPDERRALVDQYRKKYKHPVYEDDYQMSELHWLASVAREVFDKWRRGKIGNNTKPGKRILALLERNSPHKNSRHLPEREREKLSG
jgi:hypothetical protein